MMRADLEDSEREKKGQGLWFPHQKYTLPDIKAL